MKGKRYFIVEVKSMSIDLSAKHLRQAINYAANEGIEWALLTNGKRFEFYKILFSKPIDSRRMFSINLSNEEQMKLAVENIQYLSRNFIAIKGLDSLWHKYSALEPTNISKLLLSKPIIKNLKRQLKKTHKMKFSNEDICTALTKVIEEKIETVKPRRGRKVGKARVPRLHVSSDGGKNITPM